MKIADAYNYLKIGILVIEGDHFLIKEANSWLLQKLQKKEADLYGQHLTTIFPDFKQIDLATAVLATMSTADGNSIQVELSFSELPKTGQYLLSVQEAKAWVKDVEILRDKESRMQAIINTAVDGIMTINSRGLIESMNPAAAKLFGYQPEEVIGQNIHLLMPEPDHSQHDQYIKNYQQTGTRKIIGLGREVLAKRKNGHTFPIHLSVSEVKLQNEVIYTGILHDLSAQKSAEEKVRRYAKELERSNLELQDFAYVSSHDLQEPLRKIRAFGDRLKTKEAELLSEKGLDYLDRMVSAAERMQHLINDLLSFSRVSTHAKNFQEIDLNQILREVLTDLDYAIEQSAAKIEIEPLPAIEAESVQMRQLFQNLIGNALKFRKPNVAPHIKIYARTMPRKSYNNSVSGENLVKIFIEDNGIGFDEQYKDKIFQIFQRLEGRKYDGSGIGLAICKRIATRHGGDIEATSIPEKGSIFIVTLSTKQQADEVFTL